MTNTPLDPNSKRSRLRARERELEKFELELPAVFATSAICSRIGNTSKVPDMGVVAVASAW